MCNADLDKKIYFLAIGDHENHSVDTLFEIQSWLVYQILFQSLFSVMCIFYAKYINSTAIQHVPFIYGAFISYVYYFMLSCAKNNIIF